MNHTFTAVAVLFVASTTSAQTDEWSSFPTAPAAAAPATPAPAAAPVTPAPAPANKAAPAATPAPAPAPVAAPVAAPAPAPVAAPAKPVNSPTPAPSPEAKARLEERLKAAGAPVPASNAAPAAAPASRTSSSAAPAAASPAPAGKDASTLKPEELPIVSKTERFEAGSEPHSPSTIGNSLDSVSNGRVTQGQVGIGTVWVPSARLGPKGLVRVGLLGEYLNISDFPVKNATDIRSGVTFAASFQPFEWGEVFLSYGAAANTNNRTSPNLIQALGDLTLGIKASKEWTKGFWAGGDVRLLSFSGVGNQGIDKFAFGVKPSVVAAFDVRSVSKNVPLILNTAIGFTIDNSGNLVVNQKLNAAEEFALQTQKFNRFNFGISAEVPLPFVMPFVEYSLAAPLGVPSGVLTGPNGATVPVSAAMPQNLALGVKVTAIKDLTLVTGVNLGLTSSVGLGVPANPPWNFFFGASFAIDPYQKGEARVVETIRERRIEQKVAEAPKTARVEGLVIDAETKKPLSAAVVVVAGSKPVASGTDGRFQTLELTGQKAQLAVSREGYENGAAEVTLEAGKASAAEIALKPDVKKATFDVTVTSAKKPVKATVSFNGPVPQTVNTEADAKAPTKLEAAAGTYSVSASADGYLAQTREISAAPGSTLAVAFDLQPAPKKVLVTLKGDKIEILQQVHFATGKSTILADSYNLLQQVVDVVVRNGVKRIRVEGHTDNKGVKADNQKLSEDRARAVGDYLIAQGVEKSRVETVGYGDTKPVAPNLTARGRELNRRVEFLILER